MLECETIGVKFILNILSLTLSEGEGIATLKLAYLPFSGHECTCSPLLWRVPIAIGRG